MINRILLKQLSNQERLLKLKKSVPITLSKRTALVNSRFVYRRIGEGENTIDWCLSAFITAFAVSCWCTTVYMNWEEVKLEGSPGYSGDVTKFSDNELGIPPDDLNIAPIKKELIKDGKIVDLGTTARGDRRNVYHIFALRFFPDQNPYDI